MLVEYEPKIYLFNGVVFAPDTENVLTVNGEKKSLTRKEQEVLEYLLNHNGKLCMYQDIMDAVWGPVDRGFDILHQNKSTLERRLKPFVEIKTVKNRGYILTVDLKIKVVEYPKAERLLEKSPYIKRATSALILSFVSLSFAALGFVAQSWLERPYAPSYSVHNTKPIFTRLYLVGTPQLSPDGSYLLYRQTDSLFENQYLAIRDLTTGRSRPLVPMGFKDGFEWNLAGDKVVYQRRWQDNCQIRLLTLNEDKTIADDKQLASCSMNGGTLSFAWFNEHEFYLNLTAGENTTSANGLPLHHLYSFDINSLKIIKVKTAKYEGAIGFHGLEYDPSIDALYLLKAPNFMGTDFYRYQQGQLDKLATVDHLVPFYSVDDDKLIYKNNRNQLLINQPAANFDKPQFLIPSIYGKMDQPHHRGDKLAFLVGDTYRYAIYQWANEQLTDVQLEGFEPTAMASYNQQLIFASDQNGSYQLYSHKVDSHPRQISDFKTNEEILHIEVAGELFVLSYYGKVDVYRYDGSQLQLVKSLPGYNKGVFNADATKLLLTKLANGKTPATLVEMQWPELQSTGVSIQRAKLALYNKDQVIYLNQDNELIRLVNGEQLLIANNIEVSNLGATTLKGDQFYYVKLQPQQNSVEMVDLTTGLKTTMAIDSEGISKIEVTGEKLFIRVKQQLKPKIVIGDIVYQ